MLCLRVTDFSAPPSFCDITCADPGPGQIRLRIRACGLNFADLLLLKGTYQDTPDLPFTPGLEVAGEVIALGKDVANFNLGDRVAVFCGSGGLAEEGVFEASRAIPIPAGMSDEDAAAMLIAYGTSHVALEHCARLQSGETLLVTGAAGGVGLTAVEIGKLMGARVIAHARGAGKLRAAQNAGADHLIDDSEDLRAIVKSLGGSDVVYDAIGGGVWKDAFRSANPGARLLPIGFASGEVPQIPANHLLVKNLTVIGFYIGGYLKARPEVIRNSFETLFRWHGEGRIKPHVSHVLPFEKTFEGLEMLRNRTSTGKVVITMS
ncbi:oxidoreductase, zinc-binding dehydrogenase family protein [Roseobacter sp. SK209-2-6]|uniref:NADPH:quinone oxidoreductase family protein n=1 Tax=Roseobacter sp. SK209-2-6 TaxID=388739 RepID=UPI0000F3F32F|nr:NADPH:quinone oxidoreductase family protein [Roseobacter sp. SK209-2-6]EBA16566.1 oxidoreductase, zinc-binding dehydrogenase family protein [Roseobacter sp. SK209-2-6]